MRFTRLFLLTNTRSGFSSHGGADRAPIPVGFRQRQHRELAVLRLDRAQQRQMDDDSGALQLGNQRVSATTLRATSPSRPKPECIAPLSRRPIVGAAKTSILVFEGAMTDTTVKINGVSAGPTHQGGFYRFSYDITPLIRIGQTNLLEATVDKVSADNFGQSRRAAGRLLELSAASIARFIWKFGPRNL